jgi:hypothetical protein
MRKCVPDIYQQQIAQADANTLLLWGERMLDADNIEQVFGEKTTSVV